jgi:hypothetical protein
MAARSSDTWFLHDACGLTLDMWFLHDACGLTLHGSGNLLEMSHGKSPCRRTFAHQQVVEECVFLWNTLITVLCIVEEQ